MNVNAECIGYVCTFHKIFYKLFISCQCDFILSVQKSPAYKKLTWKVAAPFCLGGR